MMGENDALLRLQYLGWHLCGRRFHVQGWWHCALMFRKDDSLLIVEGCLEDAEISADLLGPLFPGFRLFYCYHTIRHLRGIHLWRASSSMETICI